MIHFQFIFLLHLFNGLNLNSNCTLYQKAHIKLTPGVHRQIEVNAYLLKLIQEKNISRSQQNQRIHAIKCYYEKVPGGVKTHYGIDRKLRDVLSREEVGAMLRPTKNRNKNASLR